MLILRDKTERRARGALRKLGLLHQSDNRTSSRGTRPTTGRVVSSLAAGCLRACLLSHQNSTQRPSRSMVLGQVTISPKRRHNMQAYARRSYDWVSAEVLEVNLLERFHRSPRKLAACSGVTAASTGHLLHSQPVQR